VQKRSLLAVPFVLAALPLVFMGPAPHRSLALFAGLQVEYSPAGAVRFFSILLKSWISVQAGILLAGTTPMPGLLAALRQLKAPRLLVSVIGLMLRYLVVISEEAGRMLRARSSRSAALPGVRSGGAIAWRGRAAGGMAGSLFLRSIERSDRVYAAMLSRGYNGEPLAQEAAPLSTSDLRLLAVGAAVLLALLALSALSVG
jgi:cobalt/nickel transport system permease protein